MDSTQDEYDYKLSTVVELIGLEKAVSYNGKRGLVVNLHLRDDRLAIMLDSGKIVQALPKNLRPKRALIPQELMEASHASLVWDGLYVGDCYAAALAREPPDQPPEWLQPLLVDEKHSRLTIVNCAHELTCGDVNLNILDIPYGADIETKWITSIQGPTLVHCVQGRSRSVAVAIAILATAFIQEQKKDALAQAWSVVTERRPQASPNLGFRLALLRAFAPPSDYLHLAKLLRISTGSKLDDHIARMPPPTATPSSTAAEACTFALSLRALLLDPHQQVQVQQRQQQQQSTVLRDFDDNRARAEEADGSLSRHTTQLHDRT